MQNSIPNVFGTFDKTIMFDEDVDHKNKGAILSYYNNGLLVGRQWSYFSDMSKNVIQEVGGASEEDFLHLESLK